MQRVLPRVAGVVLALVLSAAGPGADAAVSPFWLELGGSASGDGLSQTSSPAAVLENAVAVGGDGLPVVAYAEYPDATAVQGAIRVKRWTGSTWETLDGGAGIGIGQGYAPQVRISPGGAIHVAWLQDDVNGSTEIRLRVRTATTFDELGGSDSPGGISGSNPGITAPFSLALDAAGNPLVAFLGLVQNGVTQVTQTPELIDGTAQVYVRQWTGSAWQFVGSDFTGGGASNALSFVNAAGDTIFHDTDAPALAADSGAPVVAFVYFTTVNGAPGSNTDVYVTSWNGAAWTAVGAPVPGGDTPAGNGGAGGVSNSATGSFNPALAADASGQLALAWEEDATAGATYVWVRVWNGAAWGELAGSATGNGFAQPGTLNLFPQVALDAAGRPVVAWQALTDVAAPSQVFVRRWNGSDAWTELGFDSARNAGISDALLDVMAPSLALTPSGGSAPAGVPTVAWLDVRATGFGQVFLRQLKQYTVTVTRRLAGGEVADVNSLPDPVACGAVGTDCTTTLDFGTQVMLSAMPSAGYRFIKWTGDVCDGLTNPTCTFKVPARNVSVAPKFRQVFTLTVTKSGNSNGKITGPGITCGPDCSQTYLSGTLVTLTRNTPITGTVFHWLGDCAFRGAKDTCTLAMNATRSVGAEYRLKQLALTVNKIGPQSSIVSAVSGSVVNCDGQGGPCTDTIDYGTSVTLLATPASSPASEFVSWKGCKPVANPSCTFTMTTSRTVTATFRPQVSAVTVQTPSTGSLIKKGSRQLTAIATFTDGHSEDVTTRATWVSDDPLKVSVSPTGRVTGNAVGSANVTATFRGLPFSTITSSPLTVQVDTLLSITGVSCRPYGDQTGDPSLLRCLPSGRSFEVHCQATGRFAANPALDVDITDQVAWLSTNTAVASSTGFVAFSGTVKQSFRILNPGKARLFAKKGTLKSSTLGVLGTDPWVVHGAQQALTGAPQVGPDPASVTVNNRVQLQATASFVPTTACPIPPQRDFSLLVSWRSSDNSRAAVSFFGEVTGVSSSLVPVSITATYRTLPPDTASVTVNP